VGQVVQSAVSVYPSVSITGGFFPALPGSAGTEKVKPVWILLKQETVSGSGISKSAPGSRQITTPAPTAQFFLPPNQQ